MVVNGRKSDQRRKGENMGWEFGDLPPKIGRNRLTGVKRYILLDFTIFKTG